MNQRTAPAGPAVAVRTFVFAIALAAAGAAIAQVGSFEAGKMSAYHQSSATSLSPPQYQFNTAVFGNLPSSPAPVLTGPFAGSRTFVNTGWWHFDEGGFPSPSQLDASYPAGTYTVTAAGGSQSVLLGAGAYPNAPMVTLTGGEWVNGQYRIDPAQPLTITTNTFAAYGAGDDASVHVYLGPGTTSINLFDHWGYRSSSPNGSSVTLTVPAGTMEAGRQYYLGINFRTHLDVHSGPPSRYAFYGAVTNVTVKAERAQVFPMTVTSNITATTANASATFSPRPQDAGTTQSVYVFAVAPATLVPNAPALKSGGLSWKAQGGKADAVQCVLAQLNASGQLVAVSAAGLTAYVTGVLDASGNSVAILNNVATPNVAGTAFYVGYGTSAQQMIASGVNQRALSLAGNVSCDPRAPQTGWWYNAAEGGRGYSIEPRGTRLFMAAFHYASDGRATWNFAGGNTSIDGSLFTADFQSASGGQTMTGGYRLPSLANAGTITFAFSDATHGTMVWPGGTVAIERQPFVPNGLTAPTRAGFPESGWWWNPAESGRGFFLEWQDGFVDIAGYMYDAEGRPTWYIAALPTPDPMRVTGSWWAFSGGQAMGQPYRPATRTTDNAGALDIQFSSATTATLTLPDGRRIPLVRQAF